MQSMTENEISYKIRGAIFNVYNNLGPGLLESAYETALKIELEKEGLLVEIRYTCLLFMVVSPFPRLIG